MSIPGSASPLFLSAAAAEEAVTGVTRSLRFNDGDSTSLSKTFSSAGNRRTFTFSAWVKRCTFGAWQTIITAGNSSPSQRGGIRFRNDDKLEVTEDSLGFDLRTSRVFRDPSAWYHIVVAVDTTQSTASNRIKLYVNGVQENTFDSSSYPSQNFDCILNSGDPHRIGELSYAGNIYELDGYLADVYFIDGSALDATSFGAFDNNGVWQHADYDGSYGTNGFRLNFSDATSTTTIAKDSSGNNNDFTAANFSVTAGAGNDSLFDVPANGDQSNTGAGGEVSANYPTLSPIDNLDSGVTLSNGNLRAAVGSGTSSKNPRSTIYLNSGKWYWEMTVSAKSTFLMAGIATSSVGKSGAALNQTGGYGYGSGGNYYAGSGSVSDSSPATFTTNDVIGVKWDADAGTLEFFKNNSSQGTISSIPSDYYSPAFTITSGSDAFDVNFGQRAFSYSAPTNHKPICTATLSTPTIADGGDYFNVKTWTGTGSSHAITGYGFSPDFAWIKSRSNTASHALVDIVRGNSNILRSDNNTAENTNNTSVWTSFDSDGFTLGADTSNGWTNYNTWTYVGFAWDAGSSTASNTDGSITTNLRANQTAGFSIATYSYNNSLGSQTLGHGLGAIPDIVIRKDRNLGEDWSVYSKAMGFGKRAFLNTTAAFSGTSTFASASATTTVNRCNNMNSGNYVDLSFVSIPGFSSFGTYEGNGSTDGPFVYTGFRPKFIIMKGASSGGSNYNWAFVDTERGTGNVSNHTLAANLSNGESYFGSGANAFGANNKLDILSNGFKPRESATFHNTNGVTYLYMAWAENPFQANGGLAR